MPMIGESIAHYRVLEKLGGGGMGVVYKAEDRYPSISPVESDRARGWTETGPRRRLDHGHAVGGQDWANWSPDGKALHFTSSRDGHRCLWGQRLEAKSHRPAGEPFAVQHFHGRVYYREGGWSAAGGRIGLVLAEDTGNIWMMSRLNDR